MVSPSYNPIIGGTETFVQQAASKLNGIGIETDIMTFNMNSKWSPVPNDERKVENGLRILRISAFNPSIFNFRNHTLYGKLFNSHVIPRFGFSKIFSNYDIVHFNDDADLSFPFFSYLSNAKTFAGRRILHCHSLSYTYSSYRHNLLLGTIFKKIADLYIGVSLYTVELLLKLGLPMAKIANLPNAVDTEIFKPHGSKTNEVILYAARISQPKGLEVLLKALLSLDIQAHLVVIGPIGDKPYFSRVQYLMKELREKTKIKVTYLGHVERCTLVDWHQKASIFVCPSISDHFPISNLEALSCGTPVVATRVGAIPEAVKDNFNGILVPPGDSETLGIALKELLENRKKREAFGRNGREAILKNFSWSVAIEKLVNTYHMLID